MSKIAEKFLTASNIGAGDDAYLREELQRLKKLAVEEIDLELIDLIDNVRTVYDQESITELAQSIACYGLLVPVQVRQTGTRFQLLAGYRRFLAHKTLGKASIKAIIYNEVENQEQILVLQLTENIQRENLSHSDLERAVKQLIDAGKSREEIARLVNKSTSWVSMVLGAKQIRENNSELLKAHNLEHTLPTSTLSVLAGLDDAQAREVIESVIAENKPVTQAALKERKKQLKNQEKTQKNTLTIKLLECDGKISASIREAGSGLQSIKEKLHEFLKSLEIELTA